MGGQHLNAPIVAIAVTPDGRGYWEVASDGGIFNFGDAGYYGSMGGKPLNKPIVGIAAATDGAGYYEVATDGGVFNFGSAGFFGSAGNLHLNAPVVGIATAPDNHGYWTFATDGGVFNYGTGSLFKGSAGGPAPQQAGRRRRRHLIGARPACGRLRVPACRHGTRWLRAPPRAGCP